MIKQRDWVVVWSTIGMTVAMLIGVIIVSQVESDFGSAIDWSRPLFLANDAALCPTSYGAEAVFNRKADCIHFDTGLPVTVLARDGDAVMLRTATGQHGWTWISNIRN